MAENPGHFADDRLRESIRKSMRSVVPKQELSLKIDDLFDAPESVLIRPWYRHAIVKVAAVLLIVVTVGLFVNRPGHHEEEGEYLIDEHSLWPAMTVLHQSPGAIQSNSIESIAAKINYPVATLPLGTGKLLSAKSDQFMGIPAAALRYQIDNREMTLITADARKILRQTDEVETYHEKVGIYQLAGGNRGDSWICILADGDIPQSRLDELLNRAEISNNK